jgi:PAS domain S-box-containing protein
MPSCDHADKVDRYFLAIANTSGEILHFNNVETPFNDISQDIEHLLGYSRGELSGHPAMKIIHPADREAVLNAMASAVEGKTLSSRKIRLVKNDGSLLDVIMCPFSFEVDGKGRGGAILRDASRKSPDNSSMKKDRTPPGIIPICMCCSKIRNQAGAWQTPVSHLQSLTGADLSHGICPECAPGYYPDYENMKNPTDKKE